jgi:rod shape-determining protein MreD
MIASVYAQSTWFGAIAVFGVVPDLSLVILIWVSFKNGPIEGPVSGFCSGLLEDMISVAPLGFHAFIKTFVATLASFLHGSFFIDKLALPIVLGFVATLGKALASWILVLLFGAAVHSYSLLARILWIEACYNGLLAPLVFLLMTPFKRFLISERGRE